MIRYATFAINGPLKNCYASIEADSETTMRQWLRLHFPLDCAVIYREEEFQGQPQRYGLKEIFVATLGHSNP